MAGLKSIFISTYILFSIFTVTARAQDMKNAGAYMTFLGDQYRGITEDYMSYTSAVAHGKSARKVDNRRKTLIQTVAVALKKIQAMPAFEGDKTLRDSAYAYLKLTNYILNDDYSKIVNMEEIAERSYDDMEAYLLAQDMANAKQSKAGARLNETEKAFAAKHKVTLTNAKDDLAIKAEKAARVNAYHRIVYLIFFKSYKQEAYLLDAIATKNVNSIEQNKNSLIKTSEDGMAKLKTMEAFDKDQSIILATRQLLEFYKHEATDKIPAITGFILKEESYNKAKKSFDIKKESERTEEDVNQYNKGVNEFNAAVTAYNNTNNQLNQTRGKLIDNYNKAVSNFLDKHTPKYR